MSLRTAVYEALAVDGTLSGLGLTRDSLFANWSFDAPAAHLQRWIVLRWGTQDPGIGPVYTTSLTVQVYDRERTYGWITDVLKAAREVIAELPTSATGDGHVVGVEWSFGSEDIWDDGYEAVGRSETYRLVASGI